MSTPGHAAKAQLELQQCTGRGPSVRTRVAPGGNVLHGAHSIYCVAMCRTVCCAGAARHRAARLARERHSSLHACAQWCDMHAHSCAHGLACTHAHHARRVARLRRCSLCFLVPASALSHPRSPGRSSWRRARSLQASCLHASGTPPDSSRPDRRAGVCSCLGRGGALEAPSWLVPLSTWARCGRAPSRPRTGPQLLVSAMY